MEAFVLAQARRAEEEKEKVLSALLFRHSESLQKLSSSETIAVLTLDFFYFVVKLRLKT